MMVGVPWLRRFMMVVGVGTVAACDGPAHPPGGEVAPVAAAPVAAAPVAVAPAAPVAATPEVGEQRVTGVLRYTELPRTKSVEAYMGREFALETAGEALNIKASAAVPEARLRALDGATITVRVRFHEASRPDPRESAPMGADNTAMMRPAYHEVLEVVTGPAGL